MLEELIAVVRETGEIVRSARNIAAATHEKTSAADLVTEYDLAVEARLKERLLELIRARRPQEEKGKKSKTGRERPAE